MNLVKKLQNFLKGHSMSAEQIATQNIKDLLRQMTMGEVKNILESLNIEVGSVAAEYTNRENEIQANYLLQKTQIEENRASQIQSLDSQIQSLQEQRQNLEVTFVAQLQDLENHFNAQKSDLSTHYKI